MGAILSLGRHDKGMYKYLTFSGSFTGVFVTFIHSFYQIHQNVLFGNSGRCFDMRQVLEVSSNTVIRIRVKVKKSFNILLSLVRLKLDIMETSQILCENIS